MNFKEKLNKLEQECIERGLLVIFLYEDELKDYAGMNSEVAKVIGFFIEGKELSGDWVAIDAKMSIKIQYKNLIHENEELELMKKGMKYWNAHLLSLEKEEEAAKR